MTGFLPPAAPGGASWRGEVAASLKLAVPIAGAMLAEMGMGVADSVMAGKLGASALAAAGLGAQTYFVALLLAMGTLASVSALGAQAHGAEDAEKVSRIVRQGLILATLLSLPVIAAMLAVPYGLSLYRAAAPHFDADITAIRNLLLWALPSVPAFLWFTALRNFVTLVGRPLIVTVIAMAALPLLVFFNWVFMYGHLGAPAMGIAAIGLSSSLSAWTRFLLIALYVQRHRALRAYRVFTDLLVGEWRLLRELLRVGLPVAAAYIFESGMFIATTILIAGFGSDALAAHNVLLNIASTSFMIPYAISQAGTVRVGFEIGAARAAAARRAGIVAFLLAIAWMSCAAIGLLAFGMPIAGLYLDLAEARNAGAIAVLVTLLPIAAAFQVFDGAQVAVVGVLRGYKDTKVPMFLTFLGYWLLGFGGGWLLAYHAGLGPSGLWWGLAIGLAAASCLLLARFRHVARHHAG